MTETTSSGIRAMKWPSSLWLFGVTAMVFLLQWFPPTGMILMFAMALFWSIFLINAAFIGIAIEALTGIVSRWWLILPLLWFGGYFSYAALEQYELAKLQDEIVAHNAQIQIPFDTSSQNLVVSDKYSHDYLVSNFNLPVLFASSQAHKGAQYSSMRIFDQEVCLKLREVPQHARAGMHIKPVYNDADGPRWRQMDENHCIISMPESPALPAIRVILTEDGPRYHGRIRTHMTVARIEMPDGHVHSLKGGTASVAKWLPMPVIGCGLNSGAPSWDCSAGFLRDNWVHLQAKQADYVSDHYTLVKALGLKHIGQSSRHGADPAIILPQIAERQRQAMETELANLDRLIANIREDVGRVSFPALIKHDELVIPRLPAMIDAIELAVFKQQSGKPNARRLFDLIKQLPEEVAAPYLSRLAAIEKRDTYFTYACPLPASSSHMPDRCK